jgi:hypothetical protein
LGSVEVTEQNVKSKGGNRIMNKTLDWIDIMKTGRTPEDRERVLTWCPHMATYGYGVGVHTFYMEHYGGASGSWWIGDGNHIFDDMRVTHWAKLPKGPSEEITE